MAIAFVLSSQFTFAEEAVPKRGVFSLADRQHSLHVDFVRIIDEAQYRGLMNLYYQMSLDKKSAGVVGLSYGHDHFLFEGAYKYYLAKYFDGPFAQVGFVIGDYDGDTEGGVTAAVGFEKSLSRHLVVSGAVEMTIGSMDHPMTGSHDPLFRPMLGLTFAF